MKIKVYQLQCVEIFKGGRNTWRGGERGRSKSRSRSRFAKPSSEVWMVTEIGSQSYRAMNDDYDHNALQSKAIFCIATFEEMKAAFGYLSRRQISGIVIHTSHKKASH